MCLCNEKITRLQIRYTQYNIGSSRKKNAKLQQVFYEIVFVRYSSADRLLQPPWFGLQHDSFF